MDTKDKKAKEHANELMESLVLSLWKDDAQKVCQCLEEINGVEQKLEFAEKAVWVASMTEVVRVLDDKMPKHVCLEIKRKFVDWLSGLDSSDTRIKRALKNEEGLTRWELAVGLKDSNRAVQKVFEGIQARKERARLRSKHDRTCREGIKEEAL